MANQLGFFGYVSSYRINTSDGTLSTPRYLGYSNGPGAMAFDSDSKYLFFDNYLANSSKYCVCVFAINSDGSFLDTLNSTYIGSSLNDLAVVEK